MVIEHAAHDEDAFGDIDDDGIRPAADPLAVTTVTLEHLNFVQLRSAFVADRAALTAAGKGHFHGQSRLEGFPIQ